MKKNKGLKAFKRMKRLDEKIKNKFWFILLLKRDKLAYKLFKQLEFKKGFIGKEIDEDTGFVSHYKEDKFIKYYNYELEKARA